MPLRDHTVDAPLEGGVIERDGMPVGCWLVDRADPLHLADGNVARPRSPIARRPWTRTRKTGASRPSITWIATREGDEIRCQRAIIPAGRPAKGLTTRPDDAEAVSFDAFIRHLTMLGEHHHATAEVADYMASVMGAAPGSRPAAGRMARAMDGIRPFLDTLDGAAFGMVAAPRSTNPFPDGVYDGLDATLDPEAPLARAVAERPGYEWLLGLAWIRDRAAFRARVLAGRIDDLLQDEATISTGLPRGAMPTVAALHEATARMQPSERGSVARSLLTWREDAPEPGEVPVRAASLAALVPNGWRPRTPDTARAFVDASACVALARWACASPGDIPAYLASKGDWAGYPRRLSAIGWEPGTSAVQVSTLIDDMAKAFAAQVIEPCVAATLGDDAPPAILRCLGHVALDILASGVTLPGACNLASRWHGLQGRIASDLLRLGGGRHAASRLRWQAGLPDHDEGALRIKVITDALALGEEGSQALDREGVAGLSHCVGIYLDECLSGRSRVLSIRRRLPDGGYERSSTAQVSLQGRMPALLQHFGRSNRPPPREAARAMGAYMERLQDRSRPATWDEPPPVRPPGRTAVIGYDWRHPGNLAEAIAAWEPLLPRPLRGCAPEVWSGLALRIAREKPTAGRNGDAFQGHWRPTRRSAGEAVVPGPGERSLEVAWRHLGTEQGDGGGPPNRIAGIMRRILTLRP